MEVPIKKWFRLAPGMMVRLKSAYIIRCDSFIKDNDGHATEIHCTYFPESKSSADTSGLKVKGTIHWLSVPHAASAEMRLYDNLFTVANVATEEGAAPHRQRVCGRQLCNTGEDCSRLGDVPQREILFDREGVELARESAVSEQ